MFCIIYKYRSGSDDSVFRLAANYVMTLFEDYVVVVGANGESDSNGNESESVPLRSMVARWL